MNIPEVYTGPCATDGCKMLAEIAGYCPSCALARYRHQAVRPTPDRWLPSTRPLCGVDGCRRVAVRCAKHQRS